MYPCFSREMTIHILLNSAFLCWKEQHLFTRPFSFCLSYWIFQAFSCLCADFCTPFFSPSLKRGLSWRRNVLDTSLDYKPIPIYAVVLLCWLCEYAAGWQTQLEQVGEKKKKKKSYKPALCVLGSSTVYFYCTWSINLSIDLCCHYFLILCLSVFYAYEMRVMHCFNLCEWPLVCVRDKPAEGCQMHWMLLWIKMSIPFLCKLLCDNSAA